MSTAGSSSLAAKWQPWAPYLLSVLRIVSAFLLIPAGTMKLFASPPGCRRTAAPPR